MVPCDHVHTGGDHRGRVNQRADRRRALHRIGKPDVERDLGGLARGPHEQQQGDRRDYRGADGEQLRRRREDIRIIQAAERHEDEHDSERESEVADAVDDERFLCGVGRRLPAVPEADQQV